VDKQKVQTLKSKPTKEEIEERAQAKAHRQRLRQLREEDICPTYTEDDDEMSD